MLALDRLHSAMLDPRALAAPWIASGRIEDPAMLAIWCGPPDPAALDALDRAHRDRTGHPLDPSLRALLARHDGIAIGERFAGAPPSYPARAPVVAIGEPTIWPAAGVGDPFAALDAILPDGSTFVAFGEIPDSGWIGLGVGAHRAAVWWQDLESHVVPAHPIAADLPAFLDAWIDAGLHLPTLLDRAGAPGWSSR